MQNIHFLPAMPGRKRPVQMDGCSAAGAAFMPFSPCFSLFLTFSVCFCLFLSVYVCFLLILSVSVFFCKFLPVSSCFRMFLPFLLKSDHALRDFLSGSKELKTDGSLSFNVFFLQSILEDGSHLRRVTLSKNHINGKNKQKQNLHHLFRST